MRLLPVCLVASLSVAAYAMGSPLSRIRTSSTDKFMRDATGRVRLFHGVNAVQKGFPWYPDYMLNDTRLDQLQEWGINFVRLGHMWSGAEPAEGQFNQTYFSIITETINKLAARGIHTMLDMHEDGFSSLFCLYNGIPLWVAEKRSPPRHAFPWPLQPDNCKRFWEQNMFAEALGQAYQDLYDNHNHMRDYMARFWQQSALHFRNNTAVIGYELINEPWAGDVYKDPLLFLPALAGSQNLQPLYDNVSAAIHAVDSETNIFFEPVTWGMFLNGEVVGSGLSHVPGGKQFADRSVFSFHYYCPLIQQGPGQLPNFTKIACDDVAGPAVFDAVDKDVAQMGGSSMLTEFGTCDSLASCADRPGDDAECSFVMDQADAHFVGWAHWGYTGNEWYSDNGHASPCALKIFSRTYARAVAGMPKSMSFNTTTADFKFCYALDTSITEPTEIYANLAVHYPTGIMVNSPPAVKMTSDPTMGLYHFTPVPGVASGTEVCITMSKSS